MHNSLHGLRIIWVNTWGLVANVANVGSCITQKKVITTKTRMLMCKLVLDIYRLKF